jgi:hypothetical protein
MQVSPDGFPARPFRHGGRGNGTPEDGGKRQPFGLCRRVSRHGQGQAPGRAARKVRVGGGCVGVAPRCAPRPVLE